MSFVIKNKEFIKALQWVVPIADKKQVKPILGNLHLNVVDNRYQITTTDGELQIQAKGVVEFMESPCTMSFSAKKCYDICRILPEDTLLEISSDGERCFLKTDESRFVLSGLPAGDYPFIEKFQANTSFELPQKPLKNIFNKCFFAMAIEDIRTFLNGMFIQIRKNEIIGVTTDGHRLAMHRESIDSDASENAVLPTGEVDIIVPRRAVSELGKLLLSVENERAKISISDHLLMISFNDIIFTTKLINSRYPNYNRVIPKLSDNHCVIDKETFKQALIRTSVLCDEKLRGAQFKFEAGKLTLVAHNIDQEEAKNTILIDYSGEKISTAFNISYLLDVLNVIDDSLIRISFAHSNSGIVLEHLDHNNSLFVVMVMQV